MMRHMRLAVLLAATGLFTAQLAAATAEAASAPDVERVSAKTGVSSSSEKTARARCPRGEYAIGGGALIQGGTSGQPPDARAQVVLTRLQPVARRQHGRLESFFEASAHEDGNGFHGSWRLSVYAVCADPLPGLTYVSSASPAGSPPSQTEMVACPNGKVAVGGGGRIDGGRGQVALTEAGIQDAFTFANAYEDENGFQDRWKVTAYGVCADQPPGYVVEVVGQPQGDSASGKTADVTCSDVNQRVYGVGLGNGGQQNQVVLTGIVPSPAQSGATGVATEDESGTPAAWDMDVFLVCVD
ncbi:hypothetical protein Pta02_70090 [Planobispora takensis]|uniref:Secreted protein n=2 Tax=Planobispora takensis TaxID=1367882 RepID=A0A8J3T4D5_9ACTN|nr:hypothetical protein Pta02_70090 [Planobispora takensis]